MKDNNKKVWASRFAHLFRVHNSLKVNIPYGHLNQINIKGGMFVRVPSVFHDQRH